VVPGAGGRGLSVDARRFVPRRRHSCGGDRRRAPVQCPATAMSFLGRVPAESWTGDMIRRKGLILASNRRALQALIEATRTYRYPARVSGTMRARLEGLPKPVRDIAWKAQICLCAAIAASALRARSSASSWPRLLARWPRSCGSSGGRSRRRKAETVSSYRCPEPGGARRWGTPAASYAGGLYLRTKRGRRHDRTPDQRNAKNRP
jgi:hypothetical protein